MSASLVQAVTKPLLNVEDLAELAGVTPPTVRWWIHVGRAPKHMKIAGGRRTYFAAEDVVAWLEQSRAEGGA